MPALASFSDFPHMGRARRGSADGGGLVREKSNNADNRLRSRRRHALKDLGAFRLAAVSALGHDYPTPKRGFVA
jgi:hypothetical protein